MQMIGFIRASAVLLFHAQSQQSFKKFNQQSPINPIEVIFAVSVRS
jgi:hypothetical protein